MISVVVAVRAGKNNNSEFHKSLVFGLWSLVFGLRSYLQSPKTKSRRPLINNFYSIIFDDGICQHVAGDFFRRFFCLRFGQSGVERDLKIFSLANIIDLLKT